MRSLSVWLSLLFSSGTLVCCALPSLLVLLGLGSVMGGIITVFPQLIVLSIYKKQVFILSFIMLFIAGALQFNARNKPCPIDKEQANVCLKSRKWSLNIYLFSLIIWLIGAFFAFIAPLLLA